MSGTAVMERVQEEVKVAAREDNTVAGSYLEAAEGMEISAEEHLASAQKLLALIKGDWKRVEERRTRLKAPILQAAREADDLFRVPLATLKKAEQIVKVKADAWLNERRRIQEEERRKAEEEAEKERQRKLKLADKALERGDEKKAEEHLAAADSVPAPVAAAPPVKVPKGLFQGTRWRAEVKDVKKLCAAIAAGTVPAHMVQPNMPELNKAARALKDTVDWPGVRFVSETGISARGN